MYQTSCCTPSSIMSRFSPRPTFSPVIFSPHFSQLETTHPLWLESLRPVSRDKVKHLLSYAYAFQPHQCSWADGNTPLHLSSLFGQPESVRFLLYKYHAPVYVWNNAGKTSLDLVMEESTKIFVLLIFSN